MGVIDSEVLAIINAGNGSTVTGYPIPFSFFDPAHVLVDVQLSGETSPTRLTSGQFTVVTVGVGAPYVRTATAYPGTATVTISRWVPLTQPFDLPSVGAFSPDALERALDRIVQQIQQIWRQVSGAGEVTGPGDALGLQDVFVFLDPAARSVTKPRRAGQLGVQISDFSIWIAQSTTTGDWRDSARRVSAAQPERLVLAVCSDQGTPGATQSAIVTRATDWSADGVITAGDNHYSPATFAASWAAFSALIAAGKVWPALGNHDTADWADHYALFPYLPNNKRYYQKSFGNGLLDVFVLHSGRDTSFAVVEPDGNAVGSAQHSWFVAALNASTARWKVVVFHHPPVTVSSEANRADVAMDWPEFARVDGIFCGHVHLTEWLTCRGTPVVNVSSAVLNDGSVSSTLALTGTDATGSELLYLNAGRIMLAKLTVTQTRLLVAYHDTVSGALVYQRDLSDRTQHRGTWGEAMGQPGDTVSVSTSFFVGACPVNLRNPSLTVAGYLDTPGSATVAVYVNTVLVSTLTLTGDGTEMANTQIPFPRGLRWGDEVSVDVTAISPYASLSLPLSVYFTGGLAS